MNVLVFTAMYPTPENPAFGSFIHTQVETMRKAGLNIDVLVLKGRSRKLIYPKGIFQLRKRLAQGDIDIVHAHYSYVGMIARTQWHVPVVVTYHGDDLLGTRNEQGNLTLQSWPIMWAGQLLAYTVDAAIVQSQQMAKKLPGANVHILSHEIDFETFFPIDREQARAELGLDPEKRYLLFAANPAIAVKNYPLARDVAAYLSERDPSIELIVVHKEPQTRLNLFMNACDVLVFPSYQEGSPNIIKQAMACNLPIVATDVGDVREVIGKTPDCALCDFSVESFADHITDILARGGGNGRTQGRKDVSHLEGPLVAQRMKAFYEDVLERHHARRSRQPSS
jgi:glycosyltransferase involved in cell wall biosynthesis